MDRRTGDMLSVLCVLLAMELILDLSLVSSLLGAGLGTAVEGLGIAELSAESELGIGSSDVVGLILYKAFCGIMESFNSFSSDLDLSIGRVSNSVLEVSITRGENSS